MTKIMGKYGIIFRCNQCGEEIGDEFSDINEAWTEARREGWVFRNMEHLCPDHAGGFESDSQW